LPAVVCVRVVGCGYAYRLFGDAVIVGAVVGAALDQSYRTGADSDGGAASAGPANKVAKASTNVVRWASIEIPL
jgi:hypothetical protein